LAASLLGDAFELAELENILRIEPAMTYQLLRLAGAGADNGMRRQLRSIREALVLIGSVRLQSWVALLLLRGETDDQAGAISIALARARMCEILVRAEDPKLASLAFTAGILSAFDLLLGLDMHDIAAELSLDETLREAAFGSDSRVAQLRHDVTEYQAGRIEGNQVSGLTDHQLDTASMAAIRWAEMAAWTFADSALA
jgi:EAL and modified HD-GYP domain-containing signal transduction protein